MKVAYPFFNNGGFLGIDKKGHQGLGKDKNTKRNHEAKGNRRSQSSTDSLFDAFSLFCAIILRSKNRKRIAKILNRKLSKGVNFYSGGKSGHNGSAKAVNQALNHQNSKIHDGLLQASQGRKACDFFYTAQAKANLFISS